MIKDETGNKYGRLTVIKYEGINKQGRAVWLCKCSCGNTTTVVGKYLRNGDTTSCGCRWKETLNEFVDNNSGVKWKTHGVSKHPRKRRREKNNCYTLWRSIKKRCNNPVGSNKCYQNITICDEWKHDFKRFQQWCIDNGYKDMRDKPFKDRLSIDRIDSMKGYSPDNCRFITVSENSRRANIHRYHGNTEVN